MKHIKRNFSLKAWVRAPGVDLGMGLRPKLNFQNMVMLHIELKLTTLANILPTDTPLTQGVGSKGPTIKGIEHRAPWKQKCCHYTPTTAGVGSKGHIFFSFLKVVMLHIKLNWKKCRPTCKVTLWICTHPWPLGLGWKVRYWHCVDLSTFSLAHLSQRLKVSYCDQSSSVMRNLSLNDIWTTGPNLK